jgi:hypothetical protein
MAYIDNHDTTFGVLSVRADDIPDLSVTEPKMANNAVSTRTIQDEAVTTAKINGGAVTSDKINNSAVTTNKIATSAITAGKIGTGQVQTQNIDGGAVTTDKIYPQAVTTDKIADRAVTTYKIGERAVTEYNIFGGAVTTNKIFNGAVTTDKLHSNAVTNGKIMENAIDGHEIQAGAINFSKLGNFVETSGNGQAWAFADDVTIATTLLIKNWILNHTEDKILNPSKIICFDTNECVSSVASLFPTHGTYTAAKSVYVPSNIDTIPDSVLTFLPNVNVYYVDNPSSAVHLEKDVQTAVQNGRITIYYKDEFNLADLFATSQKNLNDRLTALETTVGTVNTALENAINGVS